MPAESAITRLIQGIYEREPDQARRILRHRIHATAARATEMDHGMVRVAAKRLSGGEVPSKLGEGRELIEIGRMDLPPGAYGDALESGGRQDAELMRAALELRERVQLRDERYLSDRRIAALLADAAGKVLGWAVNSSARNKTLHAEVLLVQSFCRRTGLPLPRGSRIFTTLKSCKMCAGMIWDSAEDPASLQVFFAEDDPGPKACRTVLNPGSHERLRACSGHPDRQSLVIERQCLAASAD